MKKKVLLASLCIPALFAACTQEEFADMQVNANREKINIELASPGISFGSGVETRMGATETPDNGVAYSWIKDDKLGAAVLDGATQGLINGDNKVLFNYAFNREGDEINGSKFTAASPVMKGIYTFYHQYNASVDRDVLNFKIEEDQEFDATLTDKSAVAQMAMYVKGISPAVDLTATGITQSDAASLQLPVRFANFGVPFKFQIKAANLPEKGAKLEKIIITKHGAGTTIDNGGDLKFGGLTTSDGDRVKVSAGATPEALAEDFANKVKAVVDNVNDGSLFTTKNNSSSISVTLKGNAAGDGIDLSKDGDVITVYVVMPNNSTSTAYDIKIQTSEGYLKLENKSFKFMSTGGDSEDPAAGVVAPSPVELNFNTNGTGNIEQPTEFNIPSEYTWSEALKYINSHPALYMTIPVTFNLIDDATVEVPADANYAAFQDLKLTLKSNGHKLNVPNDIAGNVKIANWTFDDAAKIELAADKTMAIETLPTLSASLTFVNNGTLALNGVSDVDNLKVINNKTLNMTKDASLAELTNAADAVVNVTKKLTVASLATGNAGTINIENKGELATTAACTNAGTIDVKAGGKLTVGDVLTNNNIINNAGTITSASAVTITNGTEGVINLKTGGVSNGKSSDVVTYSATSGKIVIEDITDFSAIASGKEYKFDTGSKVTTEVADLAAYNTANGVTEITDITLNGGTWKIAATAVNNNVIAVPTKSITTKGETTLLFDDNSALSTALKLTVDAGTTTLGSVDNIGQGSETAENSTAAIKVETLTVSSGASMVVPESITVNSTTVTNEAATILGTLTVDGKMYFNTAVIGSATNSDAELILTPKAQGGTAAEFGVKNGANFNNYGTVSATVNATLTVRGKVTQAKNMGNGKIIGEWDTTLTIS